MCFISDNCLGVKCCARLNLKVVQPMVNAWLSIDPCNFIVSVGFEKFEYNSNLLKYRWGTQASVMIANSLELR